MPTLPKLDLAGLPKIAPSDLKLLWVNDWYEGPLEAVVELRGARCLMVLLDKSKVDRDEYQWVVFELSPEQAADQEKWHALYAEHVGDHWCFHDDSITHTSAPEISSADTFFSMYRARAPIVLHEDKARGWTDEIPKG